MPITGLDQRGMSFPKIGDIRKGEKQEKTTKEGTKYTAPVDLDYFKVVFGSSYPELQEKFLKVYGDQPQSINIRLANNDVNRVWDYWLEAYTASRMIAKSDGEFMIYQVDPNTGEVIARPEDRKPCPADMVVGKDKQGNEIKMKYTGRLSVVVPELQYFGYLVVHTTSIVDVKNITAQLHGISEMAYTLGVGVGFIPLVMRRTEMSMSVPKGKSKTEKTRVNKWMINIAPDGEWSSLAFQKLGENAFQLTMGNTVPALSANEVRMLEDSTDAPDAYGDEPVMEEAIDGEFMPEPDYYEDELPYELPEVQAPDLMPIEMAKTVRESSKGSKPGRLYFDLSDEELASKKEGIEKVMQGELTDEQMEDAVFKLNAIKAIVQARKEGK